LMIEHIGLWEELKVEILALGLTKFLADLQVALARLLTTTEQEKWADCFFLPSFLRHIGASILGHIWGLWSI
jgi:hypothetical protein